MYQRVLTDAGQPAPVRTEGERVQAIRTALETAGDLQCARSHEADLTKARGRCQRSLAVKSEADAFIFHQGKLGGLLFAPVPDDHVSLKGGSGQAASVRAERHG